MGKELFFSGYCRAMDASRVVEAEEEDGKLWADCAWPDCPHGAVCRIAEALRCAQEEN